jgi:hypothetical protein
MKRYLAAALTAGLLAVLTPASFAASPAEDQANIRQVVETFRVSLIKKDPDTFMKLFYSETIPWIGVVTDTSVARAIAAKTDPKRPDPKKLFTGGTPRKFIEGIAKDKEPAEETFENIRIDTDGDVAQVWFDYSFMDGAYRANWGKESWHLVRTPEGWKISSVIWSMEFNPEPPPKQAK